MMKQRWGLDRILLWPTPGDPWGVEQPTETLEQKRKKKKKKKQLNPGGPSNGQKSSGPSLSLTPTHRRAIKEQSEVINRDWVKH